MKEQLALVTEHTFHERALDLFSPPPVSSDVLSRHFLFLTQFLLSQDLHFTNDRYEPDTPPPPPTVFHVVCDYGTVGRLKPRQQRASWSYWQYKWTFSLAVFKFFSHSFWPVCQTAALTSTVALCTRQRYGAEEQYRIEHCMRSLFTS